MNSPLPDSPIAHKEELNEEDKSMSHITPKDEGKEDENLQFLQKRVDWDGHNPEKTSGESPERKQK